MTTYRGLLAAVRDLPGIAEDPSPVMPSELELQALWFAGGFGRDFTDTGGRPVRIVQFGEWNRSAGPDFLHAVVSIGDRTIEGPLELDLRPADWEAHGHGADPAFSRTALHVVFSDAGPLSFTRTLEHRQVPRVLIPRQLLAEALQQPRSPIAIARPGRCVAPLAAMRAEDVASLLEEAARHRAALKAVRFLRAEDAHGRDQALYQAVAETLGYRANALPMRLLAQRLPLAVLHRPDSPEPAAALLFGAAGFLAPDLHEKAPPDTRRQLQQLWESWWKARSRHESSHRLPWKATGQRPANHPHRRLAALAAVVRGWPAFRKLALARPLSPRALIAHLAAVSDPFWTHRHTLSSAAQAQPIALFGRAQAIELLANHLYPLALHEDPHSFADYLRLTAGARNEKVRRCAIRLFGSEEKASPWLRRAAHHQALLQIYQDFCLEDLSDCSTCPFPEQLKQWGIK